MQGNSDCPKCNGTGNRSLGFMPYVACYQGEEPIWTLKGWDQREGIPKRIYPPTWPGDCGPDRHTYRLIVISDCEVQSSSRVMEGRFWWAGVSSEAISNDGRTYYIRKQFPDKGYYYELDES